MLLRLKGKRAAVPKARCIADLPRVCAEAMVSGEIALALTERGYEEARVEAVKSCATVEEALSLLGIAQAGLGGVWGASEAPKRLSGREI